MKSFFLMLLPYRRSAWIELWIRPQDSELYISSLCSQRQSQKKRESSRCQSLDTWGPFNRTFLVKRQSLSCVIPRTRVYCGNKGSVLKSDFRFGTMTTSGEPESSGRGQSQQGKTNMQRRKKQHHKQILRLAASIDGDRIG